MARRPTTAEILAAARAAGSKSAPATASTSNAAGVGTATLEFDETHERRTPVPASLPTAINGDRTAEVPPSIGKILRDVKAGREGSTVAVAVPPSVMSMLAQIRGAQGSMQPAAPPSMAKVLADTRHACGTIAAGPMVPAQQAPSEAKSATAPKRRPSTSEILAAARKKASGEAVESPATPPRGQASAPSKTSSILEAARRQGGAGSAGAVAPTTSGASRSQVAPTKPTKPVGAVRKSVDEALEAARPKAIADVLAAARASVAGGPGSLAGTTFPSLREMMAELRQSDRRRSIQIRRNQQEEIESTGLLSRFRKWVGSAFRTHRGASI